ncbi:hypothetical protein NIES2107_19980 [Nostoc carneum NIES-2107]|nr:hypothetical protein NIES2107_19980 [Nostoc carneum NIES-2107]
MENIQLMGQTPHMIRQQQHSLTGGCGRLDGTSFCVVLPPCNELIAHSESAFKRTENMGNIQINTSN